MNVQLFCSLVLVWSLLWTTTQRQTSPSLVKEREREGHREDELHVSEWSYPVLNTVLTEFNGWVNSTPPTSSLHSETSLLHLLAIWKCCCTICTDTLSRGARSYINEMINSNLIQIIAFHPCGWHMTLICLSSRQWSTQNIWFCINPLGGSHWYASGALILFKQIDQSFRKKNGSVFDRQLKGAKRVTAWGEKVTPQKAANGR